MGVRNCRDIGENLRLILQRLMTNKKLVKLLYYTDKDPLSHDFSDITGYRLAQEHETATHLFDETINDFRLAQEGEIATHVKNKYDTYEEFCQKEIYEKLIKIIPRVGPKETSNSILAVQVVYGHRNPQNGEFKNLRIVVESFVPLTQWIVKGDNLRPFYILGEIQESLDGKTVNGLGKISGGDFDVNFLTEEISCYEQEFNIISYD